MRAAGMPPDGRYLIAAMSAEADRIAGPNADRWRCDLAEELAMPPAEGTAQGAVAAALADQIVTLVPLLPEGLNSAAAHAFADRLRGASPVLDSDRSRIRLTVGVSAPAEGVAALAGALHEAQSARRLAAIRAAAGGAGPVPAVSVVTSDEVASHELLMASVPGSVLRSFRERLLGPLLAYDERHHAELLPTLREFLACSGSWNACAAAMYVHVNTVRYRIRRVEELTGRDLSRLDDQVDFFLALRIR
jgi:sugar diacid utilization regulator